MLTEYGINGALLKGIKSLYGNSGGAENKDRLFSELVDVRKGCTNSPLLFLIWTRKVIKATNLMGEVV